eukprot:gene27570-50092_t
MPSLHLPDAVLPPVVGGVGGDETDDDALFHNLARVHAIGLSPASRDAYAGTWAVVGPTVAHAHAAAAAAPHPAPACVDTAARHGQIRVQQSECRRSAAGARPGMTYCKMTGRAASRARNEGSRKGSKARDRCPVRPFDHDSHSGSPRGSPRASRAVGLSSSEHRSSERTETPQTGMSGSGGRHAALSAAAVGVARRRVTALSLRHARSELRARDPDPLVVGRVCGEFVAAAAAAVRAKRGVMVWTRGDAALAAWGAQHGRPQPLAALYACAAALAAAGRAGVACGASCGPCCVGNVGDHVARAPVVAGDGVGRAAVMARLAPHLRCSVSTCGAVREQARIQYVLRQVDTSGDRYGAPDVEGAVRGAGLGADAGPRDDYDRAFAALLRGDSAAAAALLDAHLSALAASDARTPAAAPRTPRPAAPGGDAGSAVQGDPVAARLRAAVRRAALPTPYSRRAPLPPFEAASGHAVFDGEADDRFVDPIEEREHADGADGGSGRGGSPRAPSPPHRLSVDTT